MSVEGQAYYEVESSSYQLLALVHVHKFIWIAHCYPRFGLYIRPHGLGSYLLPYFATPEKDSVFSSQSTKIDTLKSQHMQVAINDIDSSWTERLSYLTQLVFRTKYDACIILGVQNSQWHRYVSGQGGPNIKLLLRLSKLGISLDWLLTGNGEMTLPTSEGRQLKQQMLAGIKLGANRGSSASIVAIVPVPDESPVIEVDHHSLSLFGAQV